jgi:hypothetical protein
MGTAESSQSSELGGIGGFNSHSSFRRQSPNVARLIRGENSQKMEYEFPISNVNTSNLGHHHHHYSSGTSNHTIVTGNNTRQLSHQQINHHENLSSSNTKLSSNEPSSLWFSFTSCFGCRTRDSNPSTMNPLRDKVHAIRIVRASNDLTPAVFDSHYNIITLEQLRECENNGSGNLSDSSDSTNLNNIESIHNENGSISSNKNENSRRMKKKKKKRAAAAAYAARTMASDEDGGSGRT